MGVIDGLSALSREGVYHDGRRFQSKRVSKSPVWPFDNVPFCVCLFDLSAAFAYVGTKMRSSERQAHVGYSAVVLWCCGAVVTSGPSVSTATSVDSLRLLPD